jgi:integrase
MPWLHSCRARTGILAGQVFAGFGSDRFRTAVTRACKAAGVPSMSPHDLRHRRATLWHLASVPVAEAAAWLGHSGAEHLKTYAHANLDDRSALDYAALVVSGARSVRTPVRTSAR